MDRKPYTAPRLIRHGDAVEMTQGWYGREFELINYRVGPYFPFPPKLPPPPGG